MKIRQLETARALAAFLVLLFHAETTLQLEKYFGAPTFGALVAGNSGVQIFFVISGLIMYVVHRDDAEGSLAALAAFARKRFLRLYPPLWIVLSIVFPIIWSNVFASNAGLWDYVAAYLVLPAESEKMLAVEWTLKHEILFYALFALYLFHRRFGLALLLAWGVLGSIAAPFGDRGWFLAFLFNTNHLLFLLGMLLGRLYLDDRWWRLPIGLSAAVGLVLFAATWIAVWRGYRDEHVTNLGYGFGTFLVFADALRLRTYRSPPFVELLGAASYALYLTHYPIVSLLCKIYRRTGYIDLFAVRLSYFVVTIVVCLAVAILFHLKVEAPLQRRLSAAWKAPRRTGPAPA